MPLYQLGRECVAALPGVANDDIMDVNVDVSGQEVDVTTFKDVPVEEVLTQVAISDVTIEVTCTHHSAEVGDQQACTVAGLTGLDAVVLKIAMGGLSPKGVRTYTISYGVIPSEAA